MSFPSITNNLPTFSVVNSSQRAPYGTIQTIPRILDVTSYASSTLPVNLLSAGTLVVLPNTDITITLPSNESLFSFCNGQKYLSNGDILPIKIINRGTNSVTFNHDENSQTFQSGTCDCLILQLDLSNPSTPIYQILANECLPVVAQPITISNFYEVVPPYLGQYNFAYDITWPVPFTNATSYGYSSTCPDPFVFEQTGTNMVRLHIEWLSYAEFEIAVGGYNECSFAISTGPAYLPCFLAGSKVRMADGTDKNIEEVKIGDICVGAFGELNTVLALHRPLLGTSKMLCINESHHTSSHHPHIGANKTIYSYNPNGVSNLTYGHYHEVITLNGKEYMYLHGVKSSRIQQLTTDSILQTLEGPKQVSSLETYSLPSDTQLYNLVMGGSHTYFVDGYAVTGWPREDNFDYDTWTPK